MHSDMEDLPEELCTPSNLIDNHLDRGGVGIEVIKMLGEFGFVITKDDGPTIATLTAALEEARGALERLSKLTPSAANARHATDLYHTVKAIADTALATIAALGRVEG